MISYVIFLVSKQEDHEGWGCGASGINYGRLVVILLLLRLAWNSSQIFISENIPQ